MQLKAMNFVLTNPVEKAYSAAELQNLSDYLTVFSIFEPEESSIISISKEIDLKLQNSSIREKVQIKGLEEFISRIQQFSTK
jgi:hypothetical protein